MKFILFLNFLYLILFFIFFKNISKYLNIYDKPDNRKLHDSNVSLVGGILVSSSFYFYLLSLVVFDIGKVDNLFSFNTQIFVFFITSFFFFFIGLVDDKKNLSANKKALMFLILLLFVILLDPKLEIQILYFSFTSKYILLQKISLVFTVISIFLLLNAINMYDGANMQVGNYLIVSILYLSYKSESLYLAALVLPILFFLILNNSNKTFIGNSGAYFLGFILSFFIIKIYNSGQLLSDEILILLFYPIVDLVRLFFFRIIRDKNPFVADKNHIHHILLKRYKKNSKVQLILIILTIYPLLIYEILSINSLILILMNFLTYFVLVRNYLFSNDNNH